MVGLPTGPAAAATYPSPAHDFAPVVGSGPHYTPVSGATSRPVLVSCPWTYDDLTSPAGFTESAQSSRIFGPSFPNVAGYFTANSFGRLTFPPAREACGTVDDGMVTVNIGSSVAWTGLPDTTQTRRVLDAVDAMGCVDFAVYDRDGNGTLTDLEVVFQLIDATPRNCGATRGIDAGAVYDGKSLAADKEMSSSAAQTNVITIAHEIAHQALDARDLYGFGVGALDLFGPTCGPPDTTTFDFSAWQKLHLGWLQPTVVTRDGYYSVPRADTTASAFLLDDPDRGDDDYFLVENRRKAAGTYDQDASVIGGRVIWRVDDSQYGSGADTVRPIDLMRTDGATNPGCGSNGCYGGSNGDAWDPSDTATPQRTMARTWRGTARPPGSPSGPSGTQATPCVRTSTSAGRACSWTPTRC